MIDYEINRLEKSEIIIKHSNYSKKNYTESSENYFLDVSSDDIIKRINICGEEFNIYSDGENIIISHPIWSLSGYGKSLADAERNMFIEAKDAFNHYSKVSDSQLSEEAVRMKKFLHKLV